MVTTDNDEYAERMRTMSLHGICKNAWKRYMADGSWRYDILFPGYKYNLTDIAASLGVEQLKKCLRFHATRKRLARNFDQGLADLAAIGTPFVGDGVEHAWHLYVIQLDLDRLRIDRDHFIEELKRANIGCSVHFIPLHLHPFYRDTLHYDARYYPCATQAFERIISLPLYTRMSSQDQQDVIDAIHEIVERHQR